MRHIVIAVDGSKHAQYALGWARELSKTHNETHLHLVHGYFLPLAFSEGAAFRYAAERDRLAEQARLLLQRAANDLDEANVDLHLEEGAAASVVLDVAQKVKADLIAVGRRGLNPITGLLLGSVSSEILHRTRMPVLVVHDAPPRPIRRVLIGIDGSAHSAQALTFALRWMPSEAEITAVHAHPVVSEYLDLLEQTEFTADVALQRKAREVLDQTAAMAGVSAAPVRAVGLLGEAAEQLTAEYALGFHDLAVVGCRGLGVLSELLLGSVSERLLRHAPGPVIVAR